MLSVPGGTGATLLSTSSSNPAFFCFILFLLQVLSSRPHGTFLFFCNISTTLFPFFLLSLIFNLHLAVLFFCTTLRTFPCNALGFSLLSSTYVSSSRTPLPSPFPLFCHIRSQIHLLFSLSCKFVGQQICQLAKSLLTDNFRLFR